MRAPLDFFQQSEELKTKSLATITEFKHKGREERDGREKEGLGDRWG
jgi:hypothetical protein